MKLLSYGLEHRMEPRLAFSLNGHAIDVMRASLWMKEDRGAQDYLNLPSSMRLALENWERSSSLLKDLERAFQNIDFADLSIYDRTVAIPETDIVFFTPVADPPSLRYFQPDSNFIFGNTQTLLGHQQALINSGLFAQAEMAAIIAADKEGHKQAVAGYCVVNNWHDSSPGSGLAWGQATSLGPYLVTADEVDAHKLGSGFNLDLQLRVNGEIESEGRFKEMKTSFAEMIELAIPTRVLAGDIFCSGALSGLGSGSPVNQGDQVDLEIQVLGMLSTPIGQ